MLQQVGTPIEIYGDPRTLPVAQRLGTPPINVLPAQWFDGHAPRGTAHVAIRPEDVVVAADGEAAGFAVIECSLVKHQLVAERHGVEVHARVMLDEPLAPGSPARFGFPAERCLFFDAAGRRVPAAAGHCTARCRRPMNTQHIIDALAAVQTAILVNESQIESLDRAIGDGDHFINVRRGCEVLVAMRDELSPLPPAAAFGKIGTKLLSTIGGASGPLISSFFTAMGKSLAGTAEPDRRAVRRGLRRRRRSHQVARQGRPGREDDARRADPGVAPAAAPGRTEARRWPTLCAELTADARRNMLATRDMIATKGRASFLGERALGHIDPGSKTCEVAIAAVCETLKETA